jgi:hypothetical protein
MKKKDLFWLIIFFPIGLFLIWSNSNYTKKLKWGITSFFILLFVFIFSKAEMVKVNPCDCADIGSSALIVGYHNLSKESKEVFDRCKSKYTTPEEAFEDCVNKKLKEVKED